jgi:hypothetical protein
MRFAGVHWTVKTSFLGAALVGLVATHRCRYERPPDVWPGWLTTTSRVSRCSSSRSESTGSWRAGTP